MEKNTSLEEEKASNKAITIKLQKVKDTKLARIK
jgi:hypothetical protein